MTSISEGTRSVRRRRPLAFIGAVGLVALLASLMPATVLGAVNAALVVSPANTTINIGSESPSYPIPPISLQYTATYYGAAVNTPLDVTWAITSTGTGCTISASPGILSNCAVAGWETVTATARTPAGPAGIPAGDTASTTVYVTALNLDITPHSTTGRPAGSSWNYVAVMGFANPPVLPVATDVTAHTTFKITSAGAGDLIGPDGVTPYATGATVPGASCAVVAGLASCTATLAGTYQVYGTNSYNADFGTLKSNRAIVVVVAGAATHLGVSGLAVAPAHETVSVLNPLGLVQALDQFGNVDTTWTGAVNMTSSDAAATFAFNPIYLVAGKQFFAITFNTAGTQSVTATDPFHALTSGSQTGILVWGITPTHPSSYVPWGPIRILDTRNLGGSKLSANTPFSFQVTGMGLIPTQGTAGAGTLITAVTGNLTVTNPTASWAVYLGPAAVASPGSSMLNFNAGQTTAVGVTVQLSATGKLWATYMGPVGATTDLVFDVTGYFINELGAAPSAGRYGYNPFLPTRIIDTRIASFNGVTLVANEPECFFTPLPVGTVAAVGNVTVTNSTSGWAVYLGPDVSGAPNASTINFNAGQTIANGVTVPLKPAGLLPPLLCATFLGAPGSTVDVIFDLSGSYQATGKLYQPIAPTRYVDTRIGLGLPSSLVANFPRSFDVAATSSIIPMTATAVTGTFTMTNPTAGWAAFIGPQPLVTPGASTINFSVGQTIANDVTVPLDPVVIDLHYKGLAVTYMGPAGAMADCVFDVTGWFLP
jgi:hypothetical protein